MKKILIFFACILLICLNIGCNRKNIAKEISYQRLFDDGELNAFPSFYTFSLDNQGNVWGTDDFETLKGFTKEGDFIVSYSASHCIALCYGEGKLFYFTDDNKLMSCSVENGEIQIIKENVNAISIQNLVYISGKLYLHVITDESGFVDSKVKEIEISSKKMKDITVQGTGTLRGIHAGEDGYLYLCLCDSGVIRIYAVNRKGKANLICEMDYVLSQQESILEFVIDQNWFVYINEKNEICYVSRTNEDVVRVSLNGTVNLGIDVRYVSGNIVCLVNKNSNDSVLFATYLGDFSSDSEKKEHETITIKNGGNFVLNTELLEQYSGYKTKYINGSVYSEEFITELLSGNPDVDIYVFSLGDLISNRVKEKEWFVPLEESEVIRNYCKSCYDYLQKESFTDDGHLWFMPIKISANCIWYEESKLEEYQIQTEDLLSFDSFLDITEKMKLQQKESTDKCYVDTPMNFGLEMMDQYEVFIKDSQKDYNNDEFVSLFGKLWDGWKVYSQLSEHPKMLKPKTNTNKMAWENDVYNPEKVIFKWSSIAAHMEYGTLERWRVMAEPRIDTTISRNIVNVLGMVVNPGSRHKESAVIYLENIAKHYFEVMDGEAMEKMIFKEKTKYDTYLDFDLEIIKDFYCIFSEGIIRKQGYPYLTDIINGYQEGGLSLEEAIKRIERETDMWLNE